jgi:hypothetical protein
MYVTLTPNKTLSTVSNNSRNEFSEMELQMESTNEGQIISIRERIVLITLSGL